MQSWMIGTVFGLIVTGFAPLLPPVFVAPILLVAGALLILPPVPLTRFVAGIAVGCALGLLHGDSLLRHRVGGDCVAQPLRATGRVVSLPQVRGVPDGGTRQQFEFALDELAPERCAGPRKLLLFYYGEERLRPGERWQLDVTLRPPRGTSNPGAFSLQAWFVQNGVDAVGSVRSSGDMRRLRAATGIAGLHHRYRQRIGERIGELGLGPAAAAILRAITVADKGGIDVHLWGLFQQFGLNHLLVISGLHVGMVAAVGYLVGGACMRLAGAGRSGTWMPGACALLSAGLFAALAGFTLPVQRALCMLACFVGAGLARRSSGSARNLLLAAVLVLALNPLAAAGSGFWLSFGSVAALLWLVLWQQGRGRPLRWLGTHAYMGLFMLPMGALFFAGGSLVAAPANLLMIPLVGWFVVPVGLLGSVLFLLGLPLADSLWRLAAWPLAHLLPAAEQLATGGRLFLHLSASPLGALLGVLAVFLLVMPGSRALRVVALALALPALSLPRPTQQEDGPATRIVVLDVGQGTAVVIRAGDRALLYDTGGGDPAGANMAARVVLPYLRSRGIGRLDTLVISHPDLDHSAGAAAVLDALDIGRYRYGGTPTVEAGGQPCVAGETWRWPGGQTFRFLSPALETPARSNNTSCVLQVEVGDYRLLLPGDIESARERVLVEYWGGALRSDWLLAAHHGSATSSAGAFLKHAAPGTAVISSGYANRFGHPHPDVMGRLGARGTVVWQTAVGGALAFAIEPGQAPEVVVHRALVRRYWM